MHNLEQFKTGPCKHVLKSWCTVSGEWTESSLAKKDFWVLVQKRLDITCQGLLDCLQSSCILDFITTSKVREEFCPLSLVRPRLQCCICSVALNTVFNKTLNTGLVKICPKEATKMIQDGWSTSTHVEWAGAVQAGEEKAPGRWSSTFQYLVGNYEKAREGLFTKACRIRGKRL